MIEPSVGMLSAAEFSFILNFLNYLKISISGDVSSGFQSQSGFYLIHFFAGANISTLPKIHLWFYMCQPLGSWQHSRSLPHMHQKRWDLVQISGQSPPQQTNTLPFCQRPGLSAPESQIYEPSSSGFTPINHHIYVAFLHEFPSVLHQSKNSLFMSGA